MVEFLHPSVMGESDKFLESLRLTAKLQYLDCSHKLAEAQEAVDVMGSKLETDPLSSVGSVAEILELTVQVEEALGSYKRTAKILTSLTPPAHGFISEDRN